LSSVDGKLFELAARSTSEVELLSDLQRKCLLRDSKEQDYKLKNRNSWADNGGYERIVEAMKPFPSKEETEVILEHVLHLVSNQAYN
jgi:hypothetical protein